MKTPQESGPITKQIVGSVVELRNRRAAEQAVTSLRNSVNAEVGTPKCISDLVAHYRLHELTRERKAFSTIESHRVLFKRYIEPRWGHFRLSAVRTMQIEEWLHSLPLAPSSKAKLKCILSTLYNHAIRYEWLTFNPINRVRTSSKRLRDKDVLTPEEFQLLAEQLSSAFHSAPTFSK
jgi:site-specific recombinase XerD